MTEQNTEDEQRDDPADPPRSRPPRSRNRDHPIGPHPGVRTPARLLQRKYIETLEQNQKLNLCCRHVEEENHQAQWFATPTASKTEKGETIPDILIITCGLCGRKHRRFFGGGGERVITTGG